MEDLKENERIDDLEYKGLKIIQNKEGFCFGIDSILLANFAKDIKKGSKTIDLGTGTGILGILLCSKIEKLQMIGVEIQEEVFEMAKRSILMNCLEEKFKIINTDIKQLENQLDIGTFDAVVTNPPYKKTNTGLRNNNEKKLISRHEIKANLEDFIQVSSRLLKDQKNLYMVHRPERLADLMVYLRKYKLEPKKLQFVYPQYGKSPNLLLIKATKNAKPFLQIEPPLYIYKENGQYTDEILNIYGKRR
ncbi:MAG: tRNA1(Val) (adenine(37)-N6)-methyltransferase [Clostridia bacterium]|nr:tRNA1(Val) (adenine(37)-N6)-methyltransferase [Clostridia bacterium]